MDIDELKDSIMYNIPEEFKEYFYKDYVIEKSKKNKILRKMDNISEDIDNELVKAYKSIKGIDDIYFKNVNYSLTSKKIKKKETDIYFYINDFRSDDNKVPEDENYLVFKFCESIKFKIKSEKLNKEIELFMNTSKHDPFELVSSFHLPCVRAYIQNNNLYMLPSFITSMFSLINIDYKYFAGTNNPIKIFNKYRRRGFTTIMNKDGLKSFSKYNLNCDDKRYKIERWDENLGLLNMSNKIYDIGEVNEDNKYIDTCDDLDKLYETYTNKVRVSNMRHIKECGNINKLEDWICDAIF
jgi:hypothetical protein